MHIVANILNIDQPTTFQSYATIVDNVVVNGLDYYILVLYSIYDIYFY
jgi:hypothetical protein